MSTCAYNVCVTDSSSSTFVSDVNCMQTAQKDAWVDLKRMPRPDIQCNFAQLEMCGHNTDIESLAHVASTCKRVCARAMHMSRTSRCARHGDVCGQCLCHGHAKLDILLRCDPHVQYWYLIHMCGVCSFFHCCAGVR